MVTSIEQVYDGIKKYIEDKMPEALEEFDKIDQIKVQMYKQILRTSVVDTLQIKQFPTLMMEYDRVEVSRETTASDRYLMPVTFYCMSSGSNSEGLQKKSERYVWALKKIFEQDETCNNLVDKSIIRGFEFSPSLKRSQIFVHTGSIDVVFDVLIRRY